MDCIIPTVKGFKNVCANDIYELTNKKPKLGRGYCLVENIKLREVAQLTYLLQSGITVLPLLSRAKKFEKLKLDDRKLFSEVMQEGMTFAVRSIKDKKETRSSEELHEEGGSIITSWLNEIRITPKVFLSKPDVTFLIVATGEEFFIGIDVVGFNLCKRPYKLFLNPASLNSCIAYAIAREAGIKKDSVVLDPFCGTGTIPIEVALYQQEMSPFRFENKFAGLTIRYFKKAFEQATTREKNKKAQKSKVFGFDSQLKMMVGSKQNAKIAGVKESISFSKVAIDWIDTKFEQHEIDVIITQPPMISEQRGNEKEVLKLYDELCYQAKYLLNKKGVLGVFVNKPEKFKKVAEKHKLSFKKEVLVPIGDNSFTLTLFSC